MPVLIRKHTTTYTVWITLFKILQCSPYYCAQMAQTLIVVLRRGLPLWHSRDPQFINSLTAMVPYMEPLFFELRASLITFRIFVC